MDLPIDSITMTHMRLCALDTIHHAAFNKLETKLPNALLCTLPSMLWSTLLIALDCTLPACLTYTLKTLPSTLWVRSQVHLQVRSPVHSRACSEGGSQLHSMAHSQAAWLYAPKQALKTLSCTLRVRSQVYSRACSEEHSQLHSMVHSLPTWIYVPILSWLYAPVYAPACSIQRLAELQALGTERRELQALGTGRHKAGGVSWQCLVGGVWRVVCGRWRAAYGGWNHDVRRYHSLNLIFSAATETRSHDASWLWCWQL